MTVPLNQDQNDALVSFAYNVGGSNFLKSTLLRLLNERDYAAVPAELKKWTKARENGQLVDLPGLVKRRAAEAELFDRPVPNSDGAVAQSLSGVFGQAFGAVEYSVPGILEPLAQRTPRTCWAIGGTPEDKVQRGCDVIVPVPAIPQEQIDYLRTRLP